MTEVAAFPVVFSEPGDEQLSWEWDDMHMPFALKPLAADYIVHVLGAGMNERYSQFDFPQRMRCAVWHGYAYFALQPNVSEDERPAIRARYTDLLRQRAEITASWWPSEVLPELESLYSGVMGIAVEDLSRAELAGQWAAAWAAMLRAWELHFIAIMGPYQILEDLSDLYGTIVDEAADHDALRLIRGAHHELVDVEMGAEHLAALAGAHPAIAARLSGPGGVSRDDLRELDGGSAFVAALDAFLTRHGHLGQGFDDLSLASWAEDPGLILAELAKRLENPAPSATERRVRLAEDADALAAWVRDLLADQPEKLAEFERTLETARAIGPLTEGHNYWIDRMAQARLRALAIRVGARLAAEGLVGDGDDIFYLHRDEVEATLRDGLDRRELVAARRAEHDRQRAIEPPRYLGKLPDPDRPIDRFDSRPIESGEADVLRGIGASPGIATGPARVALGPDDFERIQPGDIIVCPSSNPSWVPVFTIAAGLVTNTGGVLSHAAVVAREFALPAVVGTIDATKRIADGRTVEIDGTKGTVRLL